MFAKHFPSVLDITGKTTLSLSNALLRSRYYTKVDRATVPAPNVEQRFGLGAEDGSSTFPAPVIVSLE